jgi:hypothetical protein
MKVQVQVKKLGMMYQVVFSIGDDRFKMQPVADKAEAYGTAKVLKLAVENIAMQIALEKLTDKLKP